MLKMSGATASTRVGGTFERRTGGCRPSVRPNSGRYRRGFGRTRRTCTMLSSPSGEHRCSRFNRTTFSNANNKTNNFSFSNVSVKSVFNSVFKSFFKNKEDDNEEGNPTRNTGIHLDMEVSFRRTVFNYAGRLRFGCGRAYSAYNNGKTGPNASPRAYARYGNANGIIERDRSLFNMIRGIAAYPSYNNSNGMMGSGYPAYRNANCGAGGIEGAIRVPTNVSGKRYIEVHRCNRPNVGNKPHKSLLIRIVISNDESFRHRSIGVFSGTSVSCTVTTLNKSVEVGAISKSVVCAITPNARANAHVHLGNGNIPSAEGGTVENSRCIALIIGAPANLSGRTGRTLGGFSRLSNNSLAGRNKTSASSGGGGKFVSGLGRSLSSLWVSSLW